MLAFRVFRSLFDFSRIREINEKYKTPKITMTRGVKIALLFLRLYLVFLVLVLIFKFVTMII